MCQQICPTASDSRVAKALPVSRFWFAWMHKRWQGHKNTVTGEKKRQCLLLFQSARYCAPWRKSRPNFTLAFLCKNAKFLPQCSLPLTTKNKAVWCMANVTRCTGALGPTCAAILAKYHIPSICHHLHSADIAQCDFSASPKFRIHWKVNKWKQSNSTQHTKF